MSNKYKDKINDYLINHGFFEEITITNEEYNNLSDEDKDMYIANDLNFDGTAKNWHKDKPVPLTDAEFEKYISVNNANAIEEIKKDIHTIKNSVVFFVVIAAISLFLTVALALVASL